MKEQFVNFEIAKLLCEKGFNEKCLARYYRIDYNKSDVKPSICLIHKDFNSISYPSFVNENLPFSPFYSAPLWQQVIDWFADKYKIEFTKSVGYDDEDNRLWRIFHILILEGGPLESDVHFFEEKIYDKTDRELINEYIIPKILTLI